MRTHFVRKEKIIIMGAAGRDFHNFNVFFRDNTAYEVLGFTATQIPDIGGRMYPPELAGNLYPDGIPIHDETKLVSLIQKYYTNEFKIPFITTSAKSKININKTFESVIASFWSNN